MHGTESFGDKESFTESLDKVLEWQAEGYRVETFYTNRNPMSDTDIKESATFSAIITPQENIFEFLDGKIDQTPKIFTGAKRIDE